MNTTSSSSRGITNIHSGQHLNNINYKDIPHPVSCGCISGERENSSLLQSLFQLRYRVFNQRLNWDVSSLNGCERDRFDNSETNYIVTTDAEENVKGCVRILPTTSPYMLSDIFPFLWQGKTPLPCSSTICELSRFAFDKGQQADGYGFSVAVKKLLRNLVLYAKENHIEKYVFVTTAAIERLLRIQGVSIERVGTVVPMHNAKAVVIFMNINNKTESSLFKSAQ